MTEFSPQQDDALIAVEAWRKSKPGTNGTPQIFRLFGYAGTGKTTLARHLADAVDGEVKFAAFTGKAAAVMRGKGCHNASTIHSLIYRTRESGEEIPSFDLWDDAPASKADLIIIDECSMVDAELGVDHRAFVDDDEVGFRGRRVVPQVEAWNLFAAFPRAVDQRMNRRGVVAAFAAHHCRGL